jgi:hypothetical protein
MLGYHAKDPDHSGANSPLRTLRSPTPLLYTTPNSSVMASRLAACEACRKAKVACDHKRPACSRCESNDRAGICIYRTTPFKRKRVEESPSLAQESPRYAMETLVHLYLVCLFYSTVGYHRRNRRHPTPQGQILIPTLDFWDLLAMLQSSIKSPHKNIMRLRRTVPLDQTWQC